MKTKIFSLIRILMLFTVLLSVSNAQEKEVVAYFTEWTLENNPYYVKNIVTSGSAPVITVINYAFAEPAPDSLGDIVPKFMNKSDAYGRIYSAEISVDGVADDSTQELRGHFNQLKKLKVQFPYIKILISIGGWTGSKYISDAALTPESRERFVDACIDIYIKGNLPLENGAGGNESAKGVFDGIDIDWEYPIAGGNTGIHNNPNDNNNLSELFKLFREKLDEIDSTLLLTAAVPTKKSLADQYNINNDQKYLNWYNLMTYDFYGGWDTSTGHLTNLFDSLLDPKSEDDKSSMDKSVKLFRDVYKVSTNKIIAGAAFYGRGWTGVENKNNGLYQHGGNSSGLYESAFHNYSYLDSLFQNGFKLYRDKSAQANWIYNPGKKIFWTMDDAKSIALKTRYINAYGLRGIMFWELSGDDKYGTLIKTINNQNMPDIVIKNNEEAKVYKTISVINPLSFEIIKNGTNVLIETDAVKEKFIKVEFYADSISIGYNTSPPFDWVWFNAQAGEHEIYVEATDAAGNKTLSEKIKVNVRKGSSVIKLWQLGNGYKIGDLVLYNGSIYECRSLKVNSLNTIRPGDDSDSWTEINYSN